MEVPSVCRLQRERGAPAEDRNGRGGEVRYLTEEDVKSVEY